MFVFLVAYLVLFCVLIGSIVLGMYGVVRCGIFLVAC